MPSNLAVLEGRKQGAPSRLTRNDQVVLARLERRQTPMKAYELLESLREDGINAPMTIYRALGRLTALGRVKKIETINAYYAVPRDENGAFAACLICQTCDAVGFRQLSAEVTTSLTNGLEVHEASIELKTGCFSDYAGILSGACGAKRS